MLYYINRKQKYVSVLATLGVGSLSFSDNLKYFRERAGITQDAMAKTLGVNRVTYARYESGLVAPRNDKLPELAKILGCTIDDLFGNAVNE